MSRKNRDEHNRWRSKTVAFRVSPEEDEQIEIAVKLTGLTKQDYITRRLVLTAPECWSLMTGSSHLLCWISGWRKLLCRQKPVWWF